jgi:hypothetical protein
VDAALVAQKAHFKLHGGSYVRNVDGHRTDKREKKRNSKSRQNSTTINKMVNVDLHGIETTTKSCHVYF